jgi:acyl-CoA oxidase
VDLHEVAFVPFLRNQADDEQRAAWLPAAESYRIIGCYAQTELGHGSNVRGLETTATLDTATDTLVVHSPTLTSLKWWPGGLGLTATHAIVLARLLVPPTAPANTTGAVLDHGLHAFIVQLRSLDEHAPLPGVELGDIGGKLGFNAVDNGYARFSRVRIPRRHMLMRFSRLARDGAYSRHGDERTVYGSMVYIRSVLVSQAGDALAKAATIALRYTGARRQFDMAPAPHPDAGDAAAGDADPRDGTALADAGLGGGAAAAAAAAESPVLAYPLVHRQLLPALATAYALHLAGQRMAAQYAEYEAGVNARGDFSALPDLHAASAGLKALCTQAAADGIEAARRTCGGQGYSTLSGLPQLWAGYVAVCTAEGDNAVMSLQAARYLVRVHQLNDCLVWPIALRRRGGRPVPRSQLHPPPPCPTVRS